MRQAELRLFLLFLYLSLAAVWDVCLHRVPNWLNLAAWLLGFGFSPGLAYPAVCSLPVLALYPLWSRRMLGGGDVKMVAVLFGWLGIRPGFFCFFYSLLFAGGVGICRLLIHRDFRLRFSYLIQYWRSGAAIRGLPYEGPRRQQAETSFGPALLAGVLVYWLSGGGL